MTIKKFTKKLIKKILKSTLVTWLVSLLIYLYAFLVFRTAKWKIIGRENIENILKKHKRLIGISWHGRLTLMPFFWIRKYPMNALVSLHQDGRIIANFTRMMGFKIIGGSSTANAKGSALGLIHVLEKNESVCIVPDGPRGPRQKLSMSPIFLAQKTGAPILLIMYSIAGSKIIEKSWDKMMLPKPFSKGICIIEKPIFIPENLNKKQMEEYRLKVEEKLNEMQYEADEYTGIPKILPGDKEKEKKRNRK